MLERIGDALADVRIDPLLAIERDFSSTIQTLSSIDLAATLDPDSRRALRQDLESCRTMLERCRRLAAAFDQYASAQLEIAGCGGTYTRLGDAAVPVPASTLEARG
jgi:hypothetical protein